MDNLEESRSYSLENETVSLLYSVPASLSSLVTWNITKALEVNPNMDIKEAITSVKLNIEQHDAQDIQNISAENSCQRYLTCALLAWQELGNNCVESLCRFAETRKNEVNATTFPNAKTMSMEEPRDNKFSKAVIESRCNSNEMGPVIKLPVIESTIVMCMERCSCVSRAKYTPLKVQTIVAQACSLESRCSEQLQELEVGNAELRKRAVLLAKREADRVKLIERAEAAWKDLEMGYQRRLAYAEDKELDLDQQIKRAMDERNSNKTTSSNLQPLLTEKIDLAEKDFARLEEIDKQLCERASERHKLSDECAKSDALVNEQACKAAQLDRDLQFQEDQARRKLMSLQSEVESADMLAFEANRAMTAELAALQEQINEVTAQLLQKDEDTKQLKDVVEDLRKQKNNLVEDLETCKMKCDGLMQERVDELKKKTQVLRALREEILECRCKAPTDLSVQVKRTPSLAALCKCSPEYKVLESCSCTSMRVRLMTDLLSDLFGGLQAELGKSVIEMPCQLLKCLENKHNWEKPSLVKSNLKDYFCRLLSGELDIAIATSIEKYHAKWTTPVCADVVGRGMQPDSDDNDEGWQERLIEQRAQKLATGLAEQLFNERADELTKQAKDLLNTGPPPCACANRADVTIVPCVVKNNPSSAKTRSKQTPVYWHQAIRDQQPRLQEDDIKKPYSGLNAERLEEKEKRLSKKSHNSVLGDRKGTNQTAGLCLIKNKTTSNVIPQPALSNKWHQTMQDVSALRMELENLKKDTIKKEDLETIGDKMVAQIIHQASETAEHSKARPKNVNKTVNNFTKIGTKINRAVSKTDMLSVDNIKFNTVMNKDFNVILPSKNISKSINQRTNKPISKKINPMYAVNLCLCANEQRRKIPNVKSKSVASPRKKKHSKDVSQILHENQPMSRLLPKDINELTYEDDINKCPSTCACFKKVPSNSSLDKLWETLTKLKSDLQGSSKMTDTQCIEQYKQNIDNMNLISNVEITSIISPNCFQKESVHDILSKKGNIYVESMKNSSEIENEQYASLKSNEPKGNTKSEYMGTVNLDKSNEDPYKRVIASDIAKNTHLKNVAANKYTCKQNQMFEKNQQSKSEVNRPSIQRSKQTIVVENMDNDNINVTLIKKDTKIQYQEHDIIEYKQIQNQQYSKNIKIKEHKVSSDSRNDHNIRFQDNQRNGKTDNNDAKFCSGNVCPNQVKLLGVTLADINSQKNKSFLKNYDDDYQNNVNRTQYQPSIISGKNGVFHSYDDDTNVTRYAKFSNSIPNESTHFYISKGIQISNTDPEVQCCPIFNITSVPKQDSVRSSLTQILQLDNVEKTNINEANTSVVPKQNFVLYSSDNMASTQIKVCKNYESGKCRAQRKHLKKSTSETKVNLNLPEDIKPPSKYKNDVEKNFLSESTSYKANNAQPEKPNLVSCQCSAQLNEFKKNIESTLHKTLMSKDEALDVPSFNHVKETEDSCVCHIQLNTTESKDLEENTFHLLEDYLKQKLDQLKSSSCSSACIPREEEDKLLCTILLRVKKLITDSTNQVTCNCMNKPLTNDAQGSWNRAYGLLQEYLKTKLNKAQCPCILTEDNNDTILPSVLSKVTDLIDFDFQRLKEVCGCKDGFYSQNPNKNKKKMDFNTEMAQEQMFQMPNEIVEDDKQVKTIYNHQNLSPQESIGTGMDAKIFKDVLLETDPVCDCDPNTSRNKHLKTRLTKQKDTVIKKYESLNNKNNTKYRTVAKKKQKESFSTHLNDKRFRNSTAKNNINQCNNNIVENVVVTDNKDKMMADLQLNFKSQHTKNEFSVTSKRKKQLQSKVKVSTEIKRDIFVNSLLDRNSKTQKNDLIQCSMIDDKLGTQLENSNSTIFLTAPYIGCTLESTSDPNLLEIDNVATNLISSIWSKSVSDEAYFKKVSFIMNSEPKENDYLNTDLVEITEDIQKVSTQACQAETNEQIVLKNSVESFNKTHTMTNTFDENTSIDTDYSANEDTLDWCECCSHFNPIKSPDVEKFTTKDIDINAKTDRYHLFKSSASKSKHNLCECDMIPICHVKMLIENIENELINSKCTCDLLIPKLCPIHSKKIKNVDKVIVV